MNNGNNYIALCLTKFRKAGFTKQSYMVFDETSKAIHKLIEILVSRFIEEVSQMKNPNEILQFVEQYEAGNTTSESKIAFKQLCKSIFIMLPKLKLSSTANSFFTNPKNADISEIMNINSSIMLLCQIYGVLMVAQKSIGTLFISTDGWSFSYNDEYFEKNKCFEKAVKNNALAGTCNINFVFESFIDTYRAVFNNVEKQLYQRIFEAPFFYNKITETQFVKLIKGESPQKGIIDVTDIVLQNKQSSCIKGLLFDEDNSDLLKAFLKPHKPQYRTRFKPIIKINIDDTNKYITTQDLYWEAIAQLASGQFAHNDLPDEWKQIKVLNDASKKISRQHSKVLEDAIEENLKKNNYLYLRNIKSISNITVERAPVIIDGKSINKTVGEIDFIIINDSNKSIFVVDAKYLKPTFYFTSFPVDADKFRKEGGYEDKLSYKIQWLSEHIELLSRQLKRTDILNYNIKGFFVTNNLVYYSLFSKYPIIPILNMDEYISKKNCFL